jgi:hypothetical protein
MATRHRQRFVWLAIGWLLAAVGLAVLFQTPSLELIYVLGLMGFHATIEFTSPPTVQLRWRKRLWWLSGISLIGFAVIVFLRALEVLPAEVRASIVEQMPIISGVL